MPSAWPDRLEVPWALGGAGLPTGTWRQLGRLPQFPGLCWAHLAFSGAAWAPDPTWHYAGPLRATALCL